jgi:hypothetical protein
MKIFKMVVALTIFIGLAALPATAENGQEESGESLLRAAIFVQNRAGDAYEGKIDVLNDLISARLTERGFSVLDKQYVAERFREARDYDAEIKKTIQALTSFEVDFAPDDTFKDVSVLRMAEMIGADYIIVASLTSIGHTEKVFTGEGTIHGVDNAVTDYTARITLRVLEAAGGGSVYGDDVRATERIPQTENLHILSSDIINNLLDTAAAEIASRVGGRVEKIRMAKVEKPDVVPFTVIISNVEGATIELDGAAIGTSGAEPQVFYARPGIHNMRVFREWFFPWERAVNIQANQVLTVALELSDAGIARFRDLEGFKTAMAIAREKGDASEMGDYLVSEGEKEKRESSYVHIDTSNVERLSVGGDTEISDIDVKIEEEVK